MVHCRSFRKIKRICHLLALCLLLSVVFGQSVTAKTAFSHGAREEKKVALSFDDGPHPRYTAQILAILEQYHIPATFFMIGKNVELYPSVARAVYEGGHEIGNHTYTHPHMKKTSVRELKAEILKTEKALVGCGIPAPKLFRPPEGFRSVEQVKMLSEQGYRTVVWSVDTHDWQGRTVGDIVTAVVDNVRGGDVLLFHDYTSGKNTTIAALKQIIPTLLQNGYQFVKISELMY